LRKAFEVDGVTGAIQIAGASASVVVTAAANGDGKFPVGKFDSLYARKIIC